MPIDVTAHALLSEQAKAKTAPELEALQELAIDALELRELDATLAGDELEAANRYVARQVNLLVASPHDLSTIYSESRGPFSKSFREGVLPIDALAYRGAQLLITAAAGGDRYANVRSVRG
ncbi:MAG TPA: hypothetical protein VD838_00565 [Anaeromyxobacteraceae bacterium]|nr:hypothetical protein [Anaeromyxobacteraceae bacterium]